MVPPIDKLGLLTSFRDKPQNQCIKRLKQNSGNLIELSSSCGKLDTPNLVCSKLGLFQTWFVNTQVCLDLGSGARFLDMSDL